MGMSAVKRYKASWCAAVCESQVMLFGPGGCEFPDGICSRAATKVGNEANFVPPSLPSLPPSPSRLRGTTIDFETLKGRPHIIWYE